MGIAAAALLLTALSGQALQTSDTISIVPKPVRLERGDGAFTLNARTMVVTDRALLKQGRQLVDMLRPATGFKLALATGRRRDDANHIALRLDRALEKTLGSEGYQLHATQHGVTIRAATAAGVFYGMQTLRQLMPPDVFS